MAGFTSFSNIYLTDADTDITYPGGPTWSSRTVRVDKDKSQAHAHWKRGLDVDQWIVTLEPRNVDVDGNAFPDKIGNVPWIAAARGGALDGCDFTVQRAYFAAWPAYAPSITPVGIVTIFTGRIAEVDVTDTQVVLTVNDWRELFTTMMPRDIFAAGCRHTLYDAGCTLFDSDFQVSGAATGASTTSVIVASSTLVAPGSGTFTLGKLLFTSGLNAGFTRTISNWDNATHYTVVNPFPFAVANGDTFNVYPGCNKLLSTCTAFGNNANFGGFPFIPNSSASI
jgi:Phage conserved hypothetical protein BR0599/Uncharacterized conserved protein (DUF2163)